MSGFGNCWSMILVGNIARPGGLTSLFSFPLIYIHICLYKYI